MWNLIREGVEDDVADMDDEIVRLEARVQLLEDRVGTFSLRFPTVVTFSRKATQKRIAVYLPFCV